MAIYNELRATLTCPRCNAAIETIVNMYFGLRNLAQYKIGDRINWVPRKQPQNGGRPPDGNLDGEGYLECPHCMKDAHMLVIVRSDRIIDVRPDPAKEPYVP
jgi:hypothetical protein